MSALLAARQVCLSRPAGARRGGRPAPFTPVRRVFVRAQETSDAPTVTDEELAQLVEEEDDDYDFDALDSIYAAATAAPEDGEEFAVDDDDADLQAALEAAAFLQTDVDLLTAASVSAEMDEGEDKAEAARKAEDLMALKLASGELTDAEIESLAAQVQDGELDEAEVDDYVPAMGSDRYEERPLSVADKEAVAPYKLTKGELRNLLPQDWDQINIDFFGNKKDENIPLPVLRLNVLWMEQNLAIAIDQVYSRGQVSPLTEYYFWPRQDAWEELRMVLESRPWISERDRILLLNRMTQLINYWQANEVKHTVEEARTEFPDIAFAIA